MYFDERTIKKIRRGYYSAVYFNRTKDILLEEKNTSVVTMQVFQKHEGSILCGINQVIELFKLGTGYGEQDNWISKWNTLEVLSLSDGDTISPWEPVMHITGPYAYFAHLESLYLGILAQQTLIATNMRKSVTAAEGKDIVLFADRFDNFLNQESNGYAAHIGGAKTVCTKAHTTWFGGEPVGTIPHALIAMYHGDTIAAAKAFTTVFPNVSLIVLADFTNDCVLTSLELAKSLGKQLWGVRLDTSETLIDVSLKNLGDKKELYGVNPTLVKKVREALDTHGYGYVRLVVSGGFTHEKIAGFEKEKTPVDMYGVGSAIIHGENDFTADIVRVNGKDISKVGREFRENKRLKRLPK